MHPISIFLSSNSSLHLPSAHGKDIKKNTQQEAFQRFEISTENWLRIAYSKNSASWECSNYWTSSLTIEDYICLYTIMPSLTMGDKNHRISRAIRDMIHYLTFSASLSSAGVPTGPVVKGVDPNKAAYRLASFCYVGWVSQKLSGNAR